MKAFYTILILLFSIGISKAQVTYSTTVENQLKIPTFTKKIDTTGIVNNFEALKIDTLYFKGMDLSKIDSSKIAKVYINFSTKKWL